MKLISLVSALLLSSKVAEGFSPVSTSQSSIRGVSALHAEKPEITSFDPLNLSEPKDGFRPGPEMTAIVALLALAPEAANAAPSPDWGLFEGKTGSILHPVMMGSMFGLSLSAALKGFQYRRQRTLGDEIKDLKKTLPNLGGASSLSDAIAAAKTSEDMALAAKLEGAMPIQREIDALVSERKELSSKNLRDSHWAQGSTVAFLGTAFAIEVSILVFH